LSLGLCSKCAAEGLLQQRFLQFVQRGEFALAEGFEASSFVGKRIKFFIDLFCQ